VIGWWAGERGDGNAGCAMGGELGRIVVVRLT
jgi:hypothetical protein